jgi:aminopeptidase N
MRSLTVSEARTRAASIAVSSYEVDLDLTRGDQHFGSTTVVEFDSLDLQGTWIDLQPAERRRVHLNGALISPDELVDGRLHLHNLQPHNDLVVEALMAYSHDGEGLHRSVDPEDKQAYVYAFTFLAAGPRVFACFDQPDLKAIFRVSLNAPDDWLVLGNGRATQVSPGRWELAETKPLATYFATVVAGPYHLITRDHDGILLGLACRQSLAPHLDKDADELFEVTAQCFDEYHRLFGIRYPFGDYHQVFVPEFNAGAMENPGCVVLSDTLVFKAQATDTLRATRACVVAHEMAHQWFGDLVTMTWWDDLWLNESFAEYMGYQVTHDATAFTDVWSEFAYARKAWGMAADQRPSTHPVAGNGARDTDSALSDFDGISYSKGASALRQLRAYLGSEAFIAGVVDHLRSHSYGNARLADLLESWDRVSDKDVQAWARDWLQTSGVDSLSCEFTTDGQAQIRRTNGSPVEVSRPHAIHVSWYGANGRSETIPLLITDDVTPVPLTAYDGTGLILPDSRDETWAKVRLDDRSLEHAGRTLLLVADPLARAVIWGSLREALRDSEADPEHYLQVVEEALGSESDVGVDAVLAICRTAVGTYLTHPDRVDRLASVAERLLRESAPASNRQLIAARAFLSLTSDAERLRSWLGGAAPTGLVVDEDFRWRVTRALCGLGQFGLDDIEAECQRDPSSEGALHALECRSVLPRPETKAEVWRSITTDEKLSNYELYALGSFFFRPTQGDLTAPYVERFFVDIPATTQFRSGWMVEQLAGLLFPRYSLSDTTLDLAAACAADERLPSGLRRAIADQSDDLRRGLVSHRRFNR